MNEVKNWKWVPVTPTDEMRDAGNWHICDRSVLFQAWKSMLDSAPILHYSELDAQRLRADTAEAELSRYKGGALSQVCDHLNEKLAAAEQRIAKFEELLLDMRRLPQKRCAAFIADIIDLLDKRAALSAASPATINQQSEGE